MALASSSTLPPPPPPSVAYHCSCQFADPVLPYPYRPAAGASFYPLAGLFFCEECDAVKCQRCVSTEVACYYCPHCLFEVPNASVRAELNRCARNCFNCPLCVNTLTVHASEPPPDDGSGPAPPEASYHLACNFCRWSSAETGLVFEKPTGIALQLQKMDDASPAAVEFERLREHYEPLLRPPAPTSAALTGSTHARPSHVSSSIAAASSALRRSVPALRTKGRSSVGRISVELPRSSGDGDELAPYRARGDTRTEAGLTTPVGLGEEDSALWLGQVEDLDGVAPLEARWASAWRQSIRARDLRPSRVHLRAKKTRRCMDCRHILIKPEQKAQSVRFKIKLLAASYLPTVEISPRMLSAALRRDRSARISTTGARSGSEPAAGLAAADKEGLTRGSNYLYYLAFTNPLFDPIQVELEVLHPVPADAPEPSNEAAPAAATSSAHATDATDAGASSTLVAATYVPAFIVSFPVTSFAVGAFVDAWEYGEDEDDDVDALLEGTPAEEHGPAGGGGSSRRKSGFGTAGRRGGTYLERKGNCTKLGMDLQVGKEAVGDLNFTLRVSFTYRADDGAEAGAEPAGKGGPDDGGLKTFVFDTKICLGRVEP